MKAVQGSLFACLLTASWIVYAAPADENGVPEQGLPVPPAQGWRLNIDNDLFAGQANDRDYTGGIGVTFSGDTAEKGRFSAEPARDFILGGLHDWLLASRQGTNRYYSQQIGLVFFTPEDITSDVPVTDDRPYASMLFLSNSRFDVDVTNGVAIVSRLTLGMLGLELSADIQRVLHDVTDSDTPNGWQHQVSAGGEPALMLGIAEQNLLFDTPVQQLKLEAEAVVGSITEINAGFSWRSGVIHTPWWAHNVFQTQYLKQPMPVVAATDHEAYFYAGVKASVRIYSALLQGQFRDSVVTVSSEDIERVVARAWAGLALSAGRHCRFDFYMHTSTPEFEGPNRRSMLWAGIAFSYAY